MLPIMLWTLAALLAVGAILTVVKVGKRRDVITGGTAAFTVVLDAVFVTVLALAALELAR